MPFSKRKRFFSKQTDENESTSATGTGQTASSSSEFSLVIHSNYMTSDPLLRQEASTSTNQQVGTTYRLNIPIRGSDDLIVAFSNRPQLVSITQSVSQFTELFSPGSSFEQDNPNAILDFRDPTTGGRRVAFLQIQNASLHSTGRSLTLVVVERQADQSTTQNGLLPLMNCTSLFIDGITSSIANVNTSALGQGPELSTTNALVTSGQELGDTEVNAIPTQNQESTEGLADMVEGVNEILREDTAN